MMSLILIVLLFFFFKQKTAYDMRISDWSSDVCSSVLYSNSDSRPGERVSGRTPLVQFLRHEHRSPCGQIGKSKADSAETRGQNGSALYPWHDARNDGVVFRYSRQRLVCVVGPPDRGRAKVVFHLYSGGHLCGTLLLPPRRRWITASSCRRAEANPLNSLPRFFRSEASLG